MTTLPTLVEIEARVACGAYPAQACADINDLLRIVKEMQEALGFGTEKDACINLGGAIIDIEHDAHYNGIGAVDYTCDSVSLRTLKRVEAQLGRAAQCLAPQESADGR